MTLDGDGGAALVRNESLRRGLAVLRALAAADGPVAAASLARSCGIPAPTVARLLATLGDEGMALRVAGGWAPGPALRELAGDAGLVATLVERATPLLRRLADELGESAVLCRVRLPDLVEVLAQEDADRLVGPLRWAGRTFDARRSVAGWAAAGSLAPVRGEPAGATAARARGFALDVDGLELGLTSVVVALPVPVGGWRVTVGMGAPSARVSAEADVERIAAVLAAAAEELTTIIQ